MLAAVRDGIDAFQPTNPELYAQAPHNDRNRPAARRSLADRYLQSKEHAALPGQTVPGFRHPRIDLVPIA
jgi:hypothetical protein